MQKKKQRNNLPLLHHNINTKWIIINLNIRVKTTEHLEENRRKILVILDLEKTLKI